MGAPHALVTGIDLVVGSDAGNPASDCSAIGGCHRFQVYLSQKLLLASDGFGAKLTATKQVERVYTGPEKAGSPFSTKQLEAEICNRQLVLVCHTQKGAMVERRWPLSDCLSHSRAINAGSSLAFLMRVVPHESKALFNELPDSQMRKSLTCWRKFFNAFEPGIATSLQSLSSTITMPWRRLAHRPRKTPTVAC